MTKPTASDVGESRKSTLAANTVKNTSSRLFGRHDIVRLMFFFASRYPCDMIESMIRAGGLPPNN
jgi:hypothetical protein